MPKYSVPEYGEPRLYAEDGRCRNLQCADELQALHQKWQAFQEEQLPELNQDVHLFQYGRYCTCRYRCHELLLTSVPCRALHRQ